MRTHASVFFAVLFLTWCAPLYASAASFNCARARLPVERMICADALLSELDEKLNEAFVAAGGQSSPEILADQAQWIRQRNRCTSPTCLSTLYRKRIAELSQPGLEKAPADAGAAPSKRQSAVQRTRPARREFRLPTQNEMMQRNVDVIIRLVEKTPKDIRDLRYFQNYETNVRSHYTYLTPEQRENYSKILGEWWSSALREIRRNPLSLSDIAILQNIAAYFPPERAAQLRQLANAGLSSNHGPALTNDVSKLSISDPAVEPTDRQVWEGTAPCAPNGISYQFVVLGGIEKADSVYVMWQGDKQTIVQYAARFDPMIGTIDLSGMKTIRNKDFVTLPRSAHAELRDNGRSIVMNVSPSCEVRMEKRTFPKSLLLAIADAKTDANYVPPHGLPFCVSMLAWSHEIQTGAPNLDLSRGIDADSRTKFVVASAFHDSMTVKFLGRRLTDLDTRQRGDQEKWFEWTKLTDECQANPLYFDDSDIIGKLISPFLHYLGSKSDDLQIIPGIENRVRQVAQAGGKFDATEAGFRKLREYVAPLEAELSPALKQVRLAVLKPLIDRESRIAIPVIGSESPAQSDHPRNLQELSMLADMTDVLGAADQTPEVRSAKANATAIVDAEITSSMKASRSGITEKGGDLFALADLRRWRVGTEKKFARFSGFASYRNEMHAVSQQMEKDLPTVVAGLQTQVRRSKDIKDIQTISAAIAEVQTGHDNSMASPLWQAYMRGLDGWFADHVTATKVAAAPSAPPTSRSTASIFHSPGLKNGQIVGALFDHDFLALRNDQSDAVTAIVFMVKPMNRACPGTLSEGLLRAVFQRTMGAGVFGTTEDVENAGANLLLQYSNILRQMDNDPGRLLNRMIVSAAAQDRAEADGELLSGLSCNDPDLQKFLKNAQEFLVDPTSGIPTDKLGIGDMCRRVFSRDEPSTAPYCTCAAPILERRLTPIEAAYLKSNPKANYATVVNLLPSVYQELRKCQQ